MEEPGEGSTKIKAISQIVKLKKMLHKWQNVTISSKTQTSAQTPRQVVGPGGIPPEITRRLNISDNHSDTDEELGCQSPEPSHGVPKGYLAVYVGPELRRFIIPTCYLSDPLFKVLLEKVEEEFGFDHSGALTIPCETETFKYLLQCMENHMKENATATIPLQNNNTSQNPERIESSQRRENPETSSTQADG